MKRMLLLMILIFMTMVSTANADTVVDIPLTVTAETTTTITFTWAAVPSVYAYDFYALGIRTSNTRDSARTSVKFAKVTGCDLECYGVEAWQKVTIARGGHPHAQACGNKLDDDSDGKIDYPIDPGCTSTSDNDESDPTPPQQETITSSQFAARAVPGATISNVHVTGGVTINNPNVTVIDSEFDGSVEFNPGSSGSRLLSSHVDAGFYMWGADNVTIDGNFFDGHGNSSGAKMWDKPSGDPPRNWKITNNVFQNFYKTDGSHTQAIYVGYSTDGLIEGNTFTNNGNTAHIFFTWFGTLADSSVSYPRNICVRNNIFNATNTAFYDINIRDEIPLSANIDIQADANLADDQFYSVC